MCRSRQCSQSSNDHRPQSQNSRFSHKDHHELESQNQYDDSKWYSYEQESVQIQFTTKHLYHAKQMDVAFDEIDNENMPRVLNVLVPEIHLLCMMFVLSILKLTVVLVAILFHFLCT